MSMPRSVPSLLLVFAVASAPALGAASLRPEALAGWDAYVAATERRVTKEAAAPMPIAREALSGAIVTEEVSTTDGSGVDLKVQAATIQHWRGAVFIPGATLDDVLARLRAQVPPQEDVLQSAVLERGPNQMRVYLRLRRTKIVTAVYNSEHLVTFSRISPTRAASASRSTRIAEVDNPGTTSERELAPGEDRGFLWRLNSYWRYEEVAGGVIAECESLSLSRNVPGIVRVVASPIIRSVARESLERTLTSLRAYLSVPASLRGSSPAR